MTGKNHNKKRNSILLYEFLVRSISKSLIEDDNSRSKIALKILKRHFKPGTQLYREFRLMNALAKTTVSSEHVAASILKEAKSAAINLDTSKLDREKSLLIRSINHAINDENFYDQHVRDYRTFATLQSLFNEWRAKDKDLHKAAMYEDHVMKHLIAEKEEHDDTVLSEEASGTTRLVMKVMAKKLNEKYGESLNEKQKSLIKAYAFSTATEDKTSISMKLKEIKNGLMNLIDEYEQNLHNNDYIKNKLIEAKNALVSESLEDVNDDTVTRFMLYSRLQDELGSKE